MSAPVLTLEELESDSLFQTLVDRLKFSEVVQEWSRCRQNVTRWEKEHLLVDKPSPEDLARHRNMLERLMFFGQLFGLLATHPDFSDLETADMIQGNQFILREKYQMYHHPSMDEAEADCILKEVFPES
jgi:hypothetical protein